MTNVVRTLVQRMFRACGYTVMLHSGNWLGPSTSASTIETLDLSMRMYDHQEEAVPLLRTAAPYTMTTVERMMSLYEICAHIEQRGIAGDLVECGVWRGGSAGVMAGANLKRGKSRRHIWLYDSFEGIPEPSNADGAAAAEYARGKTSGAMVSIRKLVASESAVLELLDKLGYPPQFIHIRKGWFQDTVPHKDPAHIAVLRLDGDWYESTKVCLEHLYPRVAEGGAVVIDDYGEWEGCKKAVEEYFDAHGMRPMLHRVDRTCRYFLKDSTAVV